VYVVLEHPLAVVSAKLRVGAHLLLVALGDALRFIKENAHIPPAVIAASHDHPYLVGFGLLGVCEPMLLVAAAVSACIALYTGIIVFVALVLFVIGFTTAGVRGGTSCMVSKGKRAVDIKLGSMAAHAQSGYGSVPSGSYFSRAQRAGALGPGLRRTGWELPPVPTMPTLGHPLLTGVMWVVRLSCGAAGVYVLGLEWGLW
jgi:hypothetical protein